MGDRPDFPSQMQKKIARRLRSRAKDRPNLWWGLGAMGMVGWSVAAPSVAGAALGMWLEGMFPGVHPWTLTFLVFGLLIGCWTAGVWVAKEFRSMHETTPADPGTPGEPHG